MFTEDPAIFLEDFGLPVSAGGVEGLGILDTPTEYIYNERAQTVEYLLRCEASKFAGLAYEDSVTVGVDSFKVREAPLLVDDGLFCLVLLTKVAPVVANVTTISGLNLITISGVSLVAL